ncbi:MAG: PspC domain-containing protein [Slackia sp.]|nr:PspC domain-containing protein [Slackia sp.]
MVEANRLHRSNDEVISGVCAGVAEYFDLDPIAVRILAVLLTICTFGIAAAVYVVMWLVLPGKMHAPAPIACAVYVPAASAPSPSVPRRVRGSAPVPPVGFAYEPDSAGDKAPVAAPVADSEEPCEKCGMEGWSRLCVWLGSAILAVDAVLLFDFFVRGVSWWQLWPVVLVVAGFVLLFVPAKKGSYARRFSCGLSLVAAGVVMLFISTGVLSPLSIAYAISKLWPIFLVMAGLLVMNVSLHDEMFDFGLALCVVVVCVATCTAFAVPGSLGYIAVDFPFGSRVFDVNPWI